MTRCVLAAQFGFIAQDVGKIFSNLQLAFATTTITTADGSKLTVTDPKGLNITGIIPPLVKAVQEIANIADAFKANLIAWLADASNGITDFYATVVHATTGRFSNELCVGDTCVTPAQFQAMVAAAAS